MRVLLIVTGIYSLLLHMYAFRQVEKTQITSKAGRIISYIWYTPVFVYIALSLVLAIMNKYY